MPAVERTTLIHAAPGCVYDLISRVEDFPRYSRVIHSVRALGPDVYRWIIRVAGFEFDWDSVVTEKRRPERFAWRSIRGVQNGGAFRLAAADGGTEVRFTMEYRLTNPILERIVNAIAAPLMQRVADELLAQVRSRLEPAHAG
jgi:uncharacterized membrane protein